MLLSLVPAMLVLAADEFCVSYDLTGVNTERIASSLIVYTSDHGATTESSGNGLEFVVDSNNKITAINKNNSSIPSDGFVLSAGPAKKGNFSSAKVGDSIVFDEKYNCVTLISAGYDPFISETIQYDGINVTRAQDKLIIYRNKATSGTNTWGSEAVVDANGMIISVGGNNNEIPEGGYVISGVGVKKALVESTCKLGYGATLNETEKTITIAYTKDNAVASFDLKITKALESYNKAYIEYADVELETAEASLDNLNEMYKDIQKALSEDNVVEFLALSNSFDKENKLLENALIPFIPVEARTLWLRIPTKSDDATVDSVVNEIYDMGFNSVCIELLFDSTTIMPMPEDSLFEHNPVFKGRDMLQVYIDKFHEKGIEVVAWMSCYRVGHDGSANVSRSVAKKKPEWLNTDQNGKTSVYNEYGNAYFLNPALPEVKEFLLENYRYILENYNLDGFQLDYVRYPENSTVNFGYDEYTMNAFLEQYDFEKVPTSSSQKGWSEWCKFRASFVTDLVVSVRDMIKEIRPDVRLSCDVAPDYQTSLSKMCQDTVKWLEDGIVDVVYPMAYGTTDAVEKWTNITIDTSAENVFAVIGLRDNGAATYIEQIIRVRQCGAEGSAFFSYSQYVTGDYGSVAETIFSKPAVNPTYNAKVAVLAQLNHTYETINERIKSTIAASETETDISKLIEYSEELKALSNQLESSEIKEMSAQIISVVDSGLTLADGYANGDEFSKNIAKYLTMSLNIVKKVTENSKDDLKAQFNTSPEEEENTNEESLTSEVIENNGFEKAIQAVSIIILAIGFLGLPAYLWLNARNKSNAEADQDNDEEPEKEETEE